MAISYITKNIKTQLASSNFPVLKDGCFVFTFFLLICLSTFLASCQEFLEEDISNVVINLKAPSQFAELDSVGVNFWWDAVEGATEYQFQLVSPSFDSARLFVADSLTPGNQVFFSLNEGRYEWSVRALNGGYATNFSTSTFSIDTTQVIIPPVDISNVVVSLNAPAHNINLEAGLVLFWWDANENADEYNLQIVQPSFDNTQLLVYDTTMTGTTIEVDLDNTGSYEWRVKAENDVSSTDYSLRSFNILPRKSIQLLSPNDNYKTNEVNLPFQWDFSGTVDVYAIRLTGSENFEFASTEKIKIISLGEASGVYDWFVSGVNSSNGSSVTSDTLRFEYIAGPPAAPLNRLPSNGSEISASQVLLSWERTLDNILRDSIYVLDTANKFVEGFPAGTISTQFLISDLAPSSYRWTVISLDNQGFLSVESDTLDFIIK